MNMWESVSCESSLFREWKIKMMASSLIGVSSLMNRRRCVDSVLISSSISSAGGFFILLFCEYVE